MRRKGFLLAVLIRYMPSLDCNKTNVIDSKNEKRKLKKIAQFGNIVMYSTETAKLVQKRQIKNG